MTRATSAQFISGRSNEMAHQISAFLLLVVKLISAPLLMLAHRSVQRASVKKLEGFERVLS